MICVRKFPSEERSSKRLNNVFAIKINVIELAQKYIRIIKLSLTERSAGLKYQITTIISVSDCKSYKINMGESIRF